MRFDSGRIKDLEMLESKKRNALTVAEKQKIQSFIDKIRGQAENENLAKERELLLNARRQTVNAVGEANIKSARDTADKLEEQIHNKFRY